MMRFACNRIMTMRDQLETEHLMLRMTHTDPPCAFPDERYLDTFYAYEEDDRPSALIPKPKPNRLTFLKPPDSVVDQRLINNFFI